MITEQTLQLIRSAKNIAIAIADEASLDQIGAALGLLNFLNTNGKKTEFLFAKELPPQFSFLAPYFPEEEPADTTDSLRDFIISLDAKKHGIEEIRYEKNGDALSVILGAKHPIAAADIAIKTVGDINLIISLGIPNRKTILAKAGSGTARMANAPMLLLARDSANEHDAEAMLADFAPSSWCEIIWNLMCALGGEEKITETTATPLFAGIFSVTENFAPARTTVATAKLASLLAQHGANQELIKKQCETKAAADLNLMQLWGRALSRSRLDNTTNILWSFLPADDFLKTGATSQDLPFIFARMEQDIPSPAGFLYVFENPRKNHIRAILKSKNSSVLKQAAALEAGELSRDSLSFHKSFTSFAEAEEHLRGLLAKVIQ